MEHTILELLNKKILRGYMSLIFGTLSLCGVEPKFCALMLSTAACNDVSFIANMHASHLLLRVLDIRFC